MGPAHFDSGEVWELGGSWDMSGKRTHESDFLFLFRFADLHLHRIELGGMVAAGEVA